LDCVLDELHMLDDENRGYIVELMITKTLGVGSGIQIIGMSVALSNPQLLTYGYRPNYVCRNAD